MYLLKRILIFIIRIYKKYISSQLPNRCRFYPSCSEYALQTLLKFNLIKAVFLIIKRLLKCNPFFKGGYDPVR